MLFSQFLSVFWLLADRIAYWRLNLRVPVESAATAFLSMSNATLGDSILKNDEYDFIIVGAGTAGCVIASRLAEKHSWRILLLEAGPGEEFSHTFPFVHIADPQATNLDWNLMTVPQDYSGEGLIGRKNLMSAGKVVGGTSNINHLLYIRGNHEDYNIWEREGAEGWGWEDVKPYFLKSERNANPDYVQTGMLLYAELHGRHGPLRVVDNPKEGVFLADVLFKAAREQNLYNPDSNGDSQLGFAPTQINAYDGYRYSAAQAYIRPIKLRHRKNLRVVSNAHVRKIIIDPTTKTATGVEFVVNDGSAPHPIKTVHATKEVILSAGAMNSPKVLMLSGVGPKEELEALGIEVLSDLPGVGRNLQDHLQIQMVFTCNDSRMGMSLEDYASVDVMKQYAVNGTGLFSMSNVVSFGFFRIPELAQKFPDTPDSFPHIQAAIVNTAVFPPHELVLRQNMAPETVPQYYNTPENMQKPGFIISPLFLHPKSRGNIRLASADPMVDPIIDPRFLSDEIDVMVYAKGFKYVADFFINSPEFAKIGTTPNFPVFPRCAAIPPGTEEFYACVIKFASRSAYHAVGTCKMGNANDTRTVVDSQLRVNGIKGLRVADASIMPVIISGNTHAPTVMVGEKAADLIASAWSVLKHTEPEPLITDINTKDLKV